MCLPTYCGSSTVTCSDGRPCRSTLSPGTERTHRIAQNPSLSIRYDPDRLAAQSTHREKAIADTYTLILRPFIDSLSESLTA